MKLNLPELTSKLLTEYRTRRGGTPTSKGNEFRFELNLQPRTKEGIQVTLLRAKGTGGYPPTAQLHSNNGVHVNLGDSLEDDIRKGLNHISQANSSPRYKEGKPDYSIQQDLCLNFGREKNPDWNMI